MNAIIHGKWFLVVSICVNIGVYYILNIINIMNTQIDDLPNDFYYVFMRGVRDFLSHPSDLYEVGNSGIESHIYRNLPSLIMYHYPFFLLGATYRLHYLVHTASIVFYNLGSCYLIVKIACHEKIQTISTNHKLLSNPYIIAGTFMLVGWHHFEYFQSHTQAITAFFVILGIFFMLQEKEHLAFECWSVATIFKLTIALWIVFLIVKRPVKQFLKNVLYCIIPQIPNIIMFLAWPRLLIDFIPSNIAYALYNAEQNYIVSGTLSRELARVFNLPITSFSLWFFITFIPITFILLIYGKLHFIDKIMLAVLATITVLPDFWTAHALYVIVPYMLWLSVRGILSLKWKLVCFIPLMSVSFWVFLIQFQLETAFYFPTVSILFSIPYIAMIITTTRTLDERGKTNLLLAG